MERAEGKGQGTTCRLGGVTPLRGGVSCGGDLGDVITGTSSGMVRSWPGQGASRMEQLACSEEVGRERDHRA